MRPSSPLWPRPRPLVGDPSTAVERAGDPSGWALPAGDREGLARVISARRDVRRFRADPVPEALLRQVLAAAHSAPSVGHSQPWRFVIVSDHRTRARAAVLADRARLAQAAAMESESGRQLLDLDLEGIREAPLGVVVCCDRRVPPAGVLGRATFADADMWSCACAIQNLWLAARAEGLGVGWVTLFEPDDLRALVSAPPGVETLGWLCVGWPDERPPSPGLERRGWSRRQPLDEVLLSERWPDGPNAPALPPSHLAGGRSGNRSGAPDGPPAPIHPAGGPASRLSMPDQSAVVAARDTGDVLLSPPGSLGVLDRAVDRILAARAGGPGARPAAMGPGVLVLAAADHPVAALGVSAYPTTVTRSVAEAAVAGLSVGAVAAGQAGMRVVVVDAGVDGGPVPGALAVRPIGFRGNLAEGDGLGRDDVDRLIAGGTGLARELVAGGSCLVAVGEVGVANTTVAAALTAALLGADPLSLVGQGAGSDSAIMETKRQVVTAALDRVRTDHAAVSGRGPGGWGAMDARLALSALGGGELAVLTGVILGAASSGSVVVLDGMATGAAALAAVQMEPAVAAHLVAGQRSREPGHRLVLEALGLEPLLDLRLRAGEGAGAALAVRLLETALAVRASAARTEAP